MAWMGAVAAAACHDIGRRGKKPSKFLLMVTIFSLVMGIFVPLIVILGLPSSGSITIFPLIFIFILVIGILVLGTVGFTMQYDETADDDSYRTKQRPRRTYYHIDDPREDYYWGSEPKSTAFFCMNCGMRLESDDRFCASCGRRVN
ncbi:MAG: zinc ribbon domain-containing protein [Candidatus Heimdallarchaeota archaeon]|nr:MAG: zinc ribbon domain-containing protein [Candidatus Heimdallarchaeota archaeon]